MSSEVRSRVPGIARSTRHIGGRGRRSRARRTVALMAIGCAIATGLAGCGGGPFRLEPETVDPIRISELFEDAPPARRASLRLVDEGLAADAEQNRSRAQSRYERALQVDPSNPYAYLAIARHEIGGLRPERALTFLDRCEGLLRMDGNESPRVLVHLVGIRGAALQRSGREEEGAELLDRAAAMAPGVWGDGVLSADELR